MKRLPLSVCISDLALCLRPPSGTHLCYIYCVMSTVGAYPPYSQLLLVKTQHRVCFGELAHISQSRFSWPMGLQVQDTWDHRNTRGVSPPLPEYFSKSRLIFFQLKHAERRKFGGGVLGTVMGGCLSGPVDNFVNVKFLSLGGEGFPWSILCWWIAVSSFFVPTWILKVGTFGFLNSNMKQLCLCICLCFTSWWFIWVQFVLDLPPL